VKKHIREPPVLNPGFRILKQNLLQLQFRAAELDTTDIKRLEHELGEIEREASALRSFIWNHLMRENEKGL
jgi:hypothetical protein